MVATGVYFGGVLRGELPEFAGRSMQPITVPLSIAAIGSFYLVSRWIAARPWSGRLIESGTYLSFGIYLSHPAILTGLLYLQHALPRAVTRHAISVTVAICVLDFALSVVVAALLSRTRWSRALIGRPRRVRQRGVPWSRPARRLCGCPMGHRHRPGHSGLEHRRMPRWPSRRRWRSRGGAGRASCRCHQLNGYSASAAWPAAGTSSDHSATARLCAVRPLLRALGHAAAADLRDRARQVGYQQDRRRGDVPQPGGGQVSSGPPG